MGCAEMSVRTGLSAHLRRPVALALAAWLRPWGSCHAGTCGQSAVRSALLAPRVSGKFALASDFCGGGAPALSSESAAGPVPDSAYAQQLWMYDRPTGASGAAPDAAPAAASIMPAPTRTSPSRAPTAEVLRAPKGVGREAVSRALALVPEISAVAERFGIDPLLLHAIAHVESRHNPDAVSHAGAVGLMQVMPATARRFGVTAPHSELRNPRISLEVCSAYLKNLQKRFNNDLTLVIAAYNAGEGAVEKYGRQVPPYKETQGYVRDVMAHYRLLLAARDSTRPATQAAL